MKRKRDWLSSLNFLVKSDRNYKIVKKSWVSIYLYITLGSGENTSALQQNIIFKKIKETMMATTITFNELRKIKDQLPSGSIRTIAEKLQMNEETVRNYFGGRNFDKGLSVGVHYEQGPDGGIVTLDDSTILDLAKEIING